jgi:hypothetical protein
MCFEIDAFGKNISITLTLKDHSVYSSSNHL